MREPDLSASSAQGFQEAADRYASALFDLAQEAGSLATIESDARGVLAAVAQSDDLARTLASPLFAAEDKSAAIVAVAKAMKFDGLTANFLGLVAANGRAAALPAMLKAFLAKAAKARGAARAEVASAAELSADQREKLSAALQRALGRPVEIETNVEPDLIGGLVVKIGSKMYDSSVRSKLNALKIALKGA